jgi:hypothetical protein
MEIKMRNSLQEIYFGKTKAIFLSFISLSKFNPNPSPIYSYFFFCLQDIVNDLRSLRSLKEGKAQEELAKELMGKLKAK